MHAGGSRLAEVRARRDLTQQQLADRAHVSVDTIKRIEAGRTHPNRRTQWRLARALDIADVDDLFPEYAEPQAATA